MPAVPAAPAQVPPLLEACATQLRLLRSQLVALPADQAARVAWNCVLDHELPVESIVLCLQSSLQGVALTNGQCAGSSGQLLRAGEIGLELSARVQAMQMQTQFSSMKVHLEARSQLRCRRARVRGLRVQRWHWQEWCLEE